MRFFRDTALSVLTVALTVLLLETALRLAGVRFDASLYTEDPERGYALRPDAQGWSTVENEVYWHNNSEGMHDRPRTLTLPSNALRIAVLGSSETTGGQVALDDTFEAIMERELTRVLKSKWSAVEVLNFGVPGYSLAQEYLTLRDQVWKFHPKIVMLATTSVAMIRNTRALYPNARRGTPFYVLEKGKLIPDPETRSIAPLDQKRLKWKNRISDWMNRSEILMMANEALRVKAPEFITGIKARFNRKANAANAPLPPTEHIANWTYMPDLPQVQESWQIGDAFFKAMKDDCDAHAAEFWIVVIGTQIEVHPSLLVRAGYTRQLGLPSLLASDRRIAQLAASHGIRTMLLAPPMGEYAASHGIALHGFKNMGLNEGHWNETGHRVAAGLITQELLRSSQVIAKPGLLQQASTPARTPPLQ